MSSSVSHEHSRTQSPLPMIQVADPVSDNPPFKEKVGRVLSVATGTLVHPKFQAGAIRYTQGIAEYVGNMPLADSCGKVLPYYGFGITAFDIFDGVKKLLTRVVDLTRKGADKTWHGILYCANKVANLFSNFISMFVHLAKIGVVSLSDAAKKMFSKISYGVSMATGFVTIFFKLRYFRNHWNKSEGYEDKIKLRQKIFSLARKIYDMALATLLFVSQVAGFAIAAPVMLALMTVKFVSHTIGGAWKSYCKAKKSD